jgi:hypothetical protein
MFEAARWKEAGPVMNEGSFSSMKPTAESASWK